MRNIQNINFLGLQLTLTDVETIEGKTSGLLIKVIPMKYQNIITCRVIFICGIHGKDRCIFPVLLGGQYFKVYSIEFDKDFYDFCVINV